MHYGLHAHGNDWNARERNRTAYGKEKMPACRLTLHAIRAFDRTKERSEELRGAGLSENCEKGVDITHMRG